MHWLEVHAGCILAPFSLAPPYNSFIEAHAAPLASRDRPLWFLTVGSAYFGASRIRVELKAPVLHLGAVCERPCREVFWFIRSRVTPSRKDKPVYELWVM
jgi:hypothetical protein